MQADRLLNRFTGWQGVRPGARERAHIGFERRVSPVAVVFHFKRIALHDATRPYTGQHLMGQGSDVAKRAIRIHLFRKLTFCHRAVYVLNLERLADHACEGMQYNETGARSQKISFRYGLAAKNQ